MALSIPSNLNLKNRVSIPQKRFGGNNVTQKPIGDPGIDGTQKPVGDPGIDDRIYGGGSKDFDESTGRYRSEKDKERVSIPEKRFGGIDGTQKPVGDPGIDDRIYGGGSKDFDESTGRYRSEKDEERVSIPEKRFDKRKQRLLDLQEHRARLKRMRTERRAAREPRLRIPKGEVPSKKPTLRPGAGIIERRAE